MCSTTGSTPRAWLTYGGSRGSYITSIGRPFSAYRTGEANEHGDQGAHADMIHSRRGC